MREQINECKNENKYNYIEFSEERRGDDEEKRRGVEGEKMR